MATITKRGKRCRVQARKKGSQRSTNIRHQDGRPSMGTGHRHKLDRGHAIDVSRRTMFLERLAYRGTELTTTTFLDFCRRREAEGSGAATILMDFSHIVTVLRHSGELVGAEHAAMEALTGLDAAHRNVRDTGHVAGPGSGPHQREIAKAARRQ